MAFADYAKKRNHAVSGSSLPELGNIESIELNINELYHLACRGGTSEEERFIKKLRESFLYLVEQRIWNAQDAEEIVQDILVTISGKYREITIDKSFAAWAHKVMENKLLHYYRSKGRRKRKMEKVSELGRGANYLDPDPELTRKLQNCIKKISASNNRYARILNLNYLGYSTEEICKRMAISRNNAFVILSRARSMLRHCLKYGVAK